MTDPAKDKDMARLDALLAEARSEVPVVSGDLMARVLADADAVQADIAAPTPAPAAAPAPRGLRALIAGMGGWAAVSSLATATVAGLWIGGFPPEAVSTYVDDQFGAAASVSLTADLGWTQEEG